MENYIVRIYRRGDCQRDSIVGLVESVETGETQAFHTFRELTEYFMGNSTSIENNAAEKLYSRSA